MASLSTAPLLFINFNLLTNSKVNLLGLRVSRSSRLLHMRGESTKKRCIVRFSTEANTEKEQTVKEKRSFGVVTGEFFIGIASRLLKNETFQQKKVILFPRGLDEAVNRFGIFRFLNGKEEEIASVTKDEIDPSVLWKQRRKDVDAERERRVLTSPGFSFSAAGLLFPYHLGVAQCLMEKGYITDNTPLAGSSAGAIVCAVIASGASMQDALKATKELAEDCRLNGTAFRLGAVLRGVLDKVFPDDVHVRASGRIRVAITQVFRSPRALLVDHFDSKEDLIDAVFTSSFIPGYLAPRPVTIFRKRICVDGGLTLFMPPTAAEKTDKRVTLLMAAALCEGASLGPLVNLVINTDPSIVGTALVGTGLAFACFSAAAILARRREYIFLGGFLGSGVSILLWLNFASALFGGSIAIFKFEIYFGLLLFLGYIIFDTQMIIERADCGDHDYVKHSLELFTDFAAVFVRVLIIMAKNAATKFEEEKKKRRD